MILNYKEEDDDKALEENLEVIEETRERAEIKELGYKRIWKDIIISGLR